MTRLRSCSHLLFTLAALAAGGSALAQDGPPLQATVELSMPAEAGEVRRAESGLDQGAARVIVRVTNRRDLLTTFVDLRFVYRIGPGQIALDEIIDRIEAETLTAEGEPAGHAEIDPNDVNLNPGSSTLRYRLTLYRPEAGYRVRVRIFGNYE